jgi:hypothetical protein
MKIKDLKPYHVYRLQADDGNTLTFVHIESINDNTIKYMIIDGTLLKWYKARYGIKRDYGSIESGVIHVDLSLSKLKNKDYAKEIEFCRFLNI